MPGFSESAEWSRLTEWKTFVVRTFSNKPKALDLVKFEQTQGRPWSAAVNRETISSSETGQREKAPPVNVTR